MTKSEQETIFRYAADEDVVSVWTAHLPTRRKLERAGYQPVKVSRQGGQEAGWFFKIPLAEFRWRVGARKRMARSMTEAQRRAAGDRLTRARLASDATGNSRGPRTDSAAGVRS